MEITWFKKIVLFLNASGYKLAIDLTSGNTISNKRSLSISFNIGLELCIVHLLGIGGAKNPSWVIVTGLSSIFFHLGMDIIFSKEIDDIANNYNLFYKKFCFVIYCAVVVISIIYGVCVLFNNI